MSGRVRPGARRSLFSPALLSLGLARGQLHVDRTRSAICFSFVRNAEVFVLRSALPPPRLWSGLFRLYVSPSVFAVPLPL